MFQGKVCSVQGQAYVDDKMDLEIWRLASRLILFRPPA